MTRHLVIGDIHGCFTALQALAEYVEFRPEDKVITLGDYVNRGPDSCAVLDWLIHFDADHTLIPIRGNHEIMMDKARFGVDAYRNFIECGGDATLKSYSPADGELGRFADVPDSHWEFLNTRLKPFHETEQHFYVHANAYPDYSLDEQPDFMLYWEQFNSPPRHQSGKTMVCGHTSQKSGIPVTNGNAICIDTWACGRGWLTCLNVETGTIWQAKQSGDTRRLHLDELESKGSS